MWQESRAVRQAHPEGLRIVSYSHLDPMSDETDHMDGSCCLKVCHNTAPGMGMSALARCAEAAQTPYAKPHHHHHVERKSAP